ncbi:MAG: penicillin-binding protein 2 [Candidatus Moranbacteria bacterium]|nr:penicillin-binding protein 2 [Candidatus Moranbacteria bacterium]
MALFSRRNTYSVKRHEVEIEDAVLTLTESDAAKIEWPLRRGTINFFWWFGCCIFVLLAARVMYLDVVKGEEYREAAKRNSLRALVIPASRGIVYDRFGKQLVQNVPSIDAILIPADIPEDPETQETIKASLRAIFSLESEVINGIFERLDPRSLKPLLLKERVSQEETLLFLSRSRELPGVSLYKTTERHYIDSVIFSHILGYEGKIRKEELVDHPEYLFTDSIGKQGIEKSYEAVLRGKHGFQQVEVDALGRVQKELGITPSLPGNDLILHIDGDLQKKMFDVLQTTLEKKGLRRGAALAVDPRSGAVRALVSVPSFDNNLFVGGIETSEYQALINDPALPLFNRALAGEYPPGSTIKPVLAAAALSEGVVDEHTRIESRGGISVGKFFFGDWKAHGFTDIRRAIAVSSDVFFYSLGGGYGGIRGLGMELMKKYEELFGYGKKTGIDIFGEADGFLPDADWKKEKIGERWYIGDDYHASIGQGFITATPLQILNTIATIANDGTLFTPRVVAQIRSLDGNIIPVSSEVVRKDFIDRDILRIVREGMRETVTQGTAQSLSTLPVSVAGKTGTAQFGNEEKTHGWFVSFAPYEKPTLAMIVLVEGQEEDGYNAVPITKEVLEWYFSRPDGLEE